jgi:hypothetical protein
MYLLSQLVCNLGEVSPVVLPKENHRAFLFFAEPVYNEVAKHPIPRFPKEVTGGCRWGKGEKRKEHSCNEIKPKLKK